MLLRGRQWLAPYDMRVGQDMELRLAKQEGEALFTIVYACRRFTGELNAWRRSNYQFIDLLRQQFLIFRTLSDARKADYVRRASQIFTTPKDGADA